MEMLHDLHALWFPAFNLDLDLAFPKTLEFLRKKGLNAIEKLFSSLEAAQIEFVEKRPKSNYESGEYVFPQLWRSAGR